VIVPQPLTDLNTITDYNVTPIFGVPTIKRRVFMQHKQISIQVKNLFQCGFQYSVPNIAVIQEYMYSHKIWNNAPRLWFFVLDKS